MHLNANSNEEIKTYVHPADTVSCALTVVGQVTCEIDFYNEISSVNGTVANQSQGKITVTTECHHIKI